MFFFFVLFFFFFFLVEKIHFTLHYNYIPFTFWLHFPVVFILTNAPLDKIVLVLTTALQNVLTSIKGKRKKDSFVTILIKKDLEGNVVERTRKRDTRRRKERKERSPKRVASDDNHGG